jgi:hypothetical protein
VAFVQTSQSHVLTSNLKSIIPPILLCDRSHGRLCETKAVVTSTGGGFFAMPHELQGVECPETFQNFAAIDRNRPFIG